MRTKISSPLCVAVISGLSLLTVFLPSLLQPLLSQVRLYLFTVGVPVGWVLFIWNRPKSRWVELLTLLLLIIQTIPYLAGLLVWAAFALDDGPWLNFG